MGGAKAIRGGVGGANAMDGNAWEGLRPHRQTVGGTKAIRGQQGGVKAIQSNVWEGLRPHRFMSWRV